MKPNRLTLTNSVADPSTVDAASAARWQPAPELVERFMQVLRLAPIHFLPWPRTVENAAASTVDPKTTASLQSRSSIEDAMPPSKPALADAAEMKAPRHDVDMQCQEPLMAVSEPRRARVRQESPESADALRRVRGPRPGPATKPRSVGSPTKPEADEVMGVHDEVHRPDATQHRTSTFAIEEAVVKRILAVCRSAGPRVEAWSITMPIDEEAFPSTSLRIQASRNWIRFRFSTQSSESVRRLSVYLPQLEQRLMDELNMQHQIDVDLE